MPSLLQGLEDIPEKLGTGNAEGTKTSVGGFYRRGCTWRVGLVSAQRRLDLLSLLSGTAVALMTQARVSLPWLFLPT